MTPNHVFYTFQGSLIIFQNFGFSLIFDPLDFEIFGGRQIEVMLVLWALALGKGLGLERSYLADVLRIHPRTDQDNEKLRFRQLGEHGGSKNGTFGENVKNVKKLKDAENMFFTRFRGP